MSQEMPKPQQENQKRSSKYEVPQILPLKGDALEYQHTWEEQFKNPEQIELYGEYKMEVIDLKPEKPISEVPAIFLRGWGTTADVYKTNLKEIARAQRRAIAIDEPHGIDIENLPDEERFKGQEIPEVELRKVTALLKTIDEKELVQVDLITHSEGAIYGSYAALLRPDKVRSMVVVDPAGMVGEDKQGRLLAGAALDVALQTARIYRNILKQGGIDAFKKSMIGGRDVAKVVASNPKHQLESIAVIAESQVHEILETLRDLGIKIAIIHGVDDKFFSMEKVQKKTLEKNQEGETVHRSADGFYSVQGTHNEIYLHPERFTKVINHALDALEALSLKEKAGKGVEK